MTHNAKVVRVLEGGCAEVMVHRSSACGHNCVSCNMCRANPEAIVVVAENQIHARCGDSVMLESSSKNVLWLATLVYLVPFLLFFAGYLVSVLFEMKDPWDIILGTLGFLIGIGIDLLQNRKMRKHPSVIYRIIDLGN